MLWVVQPVNCEVYMVDLQKCVRGGSVEECVGSVKLYVGNLPKYVGVCQSVCCRSVKVCVVDLSMLVCGICQTICVGVCQWGCGDLPMCVWGIYQSMCRICQCLCGDLPMWVCGISQMGPQFQKDRAHKSVKTPMSWSSYRHVYARCCRSD